MKLILCIVIDNDISYLQIQIWNTFYPTICGIK